MADEIKIQILENGQIKIETSQVSGGNHVNAEALIREIGRLAGGTMKRTLKPGASLRHALHTHTQDGHHH